jgi:alkylation response protein AidB-like acyl-CoA dehydrogenase
MNLALSDEQRMIRESADAVLAELASSVRTRAAMESEAGFDAAAWEHIAAELGWCAMAVPEVHGGLGLGAVELVQLFEPMCRQLFCSPYFSTVALALPVLLYAADEAARERWLPKLAEGRLRISAAMPDGAGDQPRSLLTAYCTKGRWQLGGRVDRLVDGASAELLLLPARCEDGVGWFAVRAEAARCEPIAGWDRTRRFASIALEAAPALRLDAKREHASKSAALSRLCLAAEQLGGAQACLDMTVAYVGERKQFGRSIASFQAVKHRCAQMMVEVEALRSTVYGAAALFASIDSAPSSGIGECRLLADECALALALAKDTYFNCAQEAIQLHGGVGFTWEYDPQLHLKRAQAGAHWMGTASALRERIAERVFA